MRLTKKVIYLYAVPTELIPEASQIIPSACNIPVGLLPEVIHRSDGDVAGKVAGLFAWFKDNLVEEGGFLVASAALPALSLDEAVWAEAMKTLRGVLEKYERVQGPVFVPSLSATRTDRFAVADLYTRLLNGSTMLPVVTFKQERKWEAEVVEEELDAANKVEQTEEIAQ